MLEHLKYKRAKKHQAQLPKSKSPVLSPADEQFLQKIVSPEETPPPPPERHPDRVAGNSTGNAEQIVMENRELQLVEDVREMKGEGKGNAKKDNKRWSFLHRGFSRQDKKMAAEVQADGLAVSNDG
jgi:hypothetical protein